MYKNKKRLRQLLELASALFGLAAAIMYLQEIKESKIREEIAE